MTIALLKGQIITGDGRVLNRGAVLIKGERITKVAEADIPIPRGAEKMDLSGRTLLPGLIDAHVHLCLDGSPNPLEAAKRGGAALVALKAAGHARQTLLAGVTSVRDMGGMEGVDLALRDAINQKVILGPRMKASARPVCMTGGHGWEFGREADGPDEVRKAAREQIRAGADIVKLMATGGVMTRGVEPGSAQLTEEEMRAGIEEAHKAGRQTATHAQGTEGILNALKAGIDSIEHGFFLTEEAIALMVHRGVALVPTLAAVHFIVAEGLEAGIPDFIVEKARRVQAAHIKSVRLAKEAGVKIAMGTDAGTPFNLHGRNLKEVELMNQIGFSPIEAISATTSVAAEILGWGQELGTIEQGKLADLVVVDGDPLQDLSLLSEADKISLVMKGGVVVKA